MDLLSDTSSFTCRVSSVLNRNVKEFGKKLLFDGREDTCWNSDQGSPQMVTVKFEEPKTLKELQLMFQGGFVGKNCYLEVSENDIEFTKCFEFKPEDNNKLQKFAIESEIKGQIFRIVFSESTDFFGRITLYQLKMISSSE